MNDKLTSTGNMIGVEGTKMISESLKINSTLTKLNLSCDEKLEYKMNWNGKQRWINRKQH